MLLYTSKIERFCGFAEFWYLFPLLVFAFKASSNMCVYTYNTSFFKGRRESLGCFWWVYNESSHGGTYISSRIRVWSCIYIYTLCRDSTCIHIYIYDYVFKSLDPPQEPEPANTQTCFLKHSRFLLIDYDHSWSNSPYLGGGSLDPLATATVCHREPGSLRAWKVSKRTPAQRWVSWHRNLLEIWRFWHSVPGGQKERNIIYPYVGFQTPGEEVFGPQKHT